MKDNVFFLIKDLEKMIIRKLVPFDKQSSSLERRVPTPTQMRIIGFILESKDAVYQKDLEEALNLRRATISDVLKRMENKGLVKREKNTNDFRSKRIILSDGAKNIFKKNEEKLELLEKLAIKDITGKDLEIFSSVLNKMIENLNDVDV